jgi:hypothetical protein
VCFDLKKKVEKNQRLQQKLKYQKTRVQALFINPNSALGEQPLLCVASTSTCVSAGSEMAPLRDNARKTRSATCEQNTPDFFQVSGFSQSSSVSHGSMAVTQHCQRSA